MILHIRKARILIGIVCVLLSIGAISIWFSKLRTVEETSLPSVETIDRVCTPKKTKCFQVVDRVMQWDGDEFVSRSLESLLPSGSASIESVVKIVPVKHNATFYDSDTRLWKVDGEELGSNPMRGMTMMPFLTRVFRLKRRKEPKKIALIGGGGAAILSHLRTLRDGIEATVVEKEQAVVMLAKRWFDLRDADVITEDGVKWMQNSDANSSRYDVIFLDACVRQSAQHCPDPIFMKEENVKNLHRMLIDDSRALVVINFEIYNSQKWEMLQKQMGVLLSVFSHCVSVDLKEEVNMIVGCLTRPLPFYNSENPRASLDASMGFIVDQYPEAQAELQYGKVFREFGVHTIIEGKRESVLAPADKAL